MSARVMKHEFFRLGDDGADFTLVADRNGDIRVDVRAKAEEVAEILFRDQHQVG